MINELIKVGVGMATGVIALATLSVIVSRRSNTQAVIQATGSALSNIVAAAVNPVHTAATNANLNIAPLAGIAPTPGVPPANGQ